jgi:hypothetical protein
MEFTSLHEEAKAALEAAAKNAMLGVLIGKQADTTTSARQQ